MLLMPHPHILARDLPQYSASSWFGALTRAREAEEAKVTSVAMNQICFQHFWS